MGWQASSVSGVSGCDRSGKRVVRWRLRLSFIPRIECCSNSSYFMVFSTPKVVFRCCWHFFHGGIFANLFRGSLSGRRFSRVCCWRCHWSFALASMLQNGLDSGSKYNDVKVLISPLRTAGWGAPARLFLRICSFLSIAKPHWPKSLQIIALF